MTAINLIFLGIVVVALGFFALNAQRLYRYLRVGRDERRLDAPLVRVGNLLAIGVGQAKILRDPVAGALHATVFWGFVDLMDRIWVIGSYLKSLPS